MSNLDAARWQMAISLGFHILFAVAGMAMPLLMVIAEAKYLRSGRALYRELAQRWAKGTAILFAVGAVSGTALSFELGLLWPRFMVIAGPLIGLPFSLEGFAFFLESIFLGLYLYGWDRLPKRVHLASGVVVAISGLASGVFVVAVNSFMNLPVFGDPWSPFRSPAFFTQALHMSIAAYESVAFMVLGIHASRLWVDPNNELHREAAKIALVVAMIAAPLQIVSGDLSAKHVAKEQPTKLAAAEGHFRTERGAPLNIGGWPNMKTLELDYALRIPKGLSILAFGDPDAEVLGLTDFHPTTWPPVQVVHPAFQVMVGCGGMMVLLAMFGGFLWVRKKDPFSNKKFLGAAVLVAPLGMIALEAGWIVTEVGRQPWIINGVLKTRDAVTPMPNLIVPLIVFVLLYLFLGTVVIFLLRGHVFNVPVSKGSGR